MHYDLLVHVDSDDAAVLGLALANIVNYRAALPQDQFHVVLVANGPAVKQFVLQEQTHAPVIADLHAAGVSFRMCNNALTKFGIAPETLQTTCEVVPAGVVEVVDLQRKGYAYIKP